MSNDYKTLQLTPELAMVDYYNIVDYTCIK